jgi:hypothetical protein
LSAIAGNSISTRPASFLFPTAERRTNKVIHNKLLAAVAGVPTIKAKSYFRGKVSGCKYSFQISCYLSEFAFFFILLRHE